MIEILGELEPGHADTVTPAGPQPKCGQVRLHNPEHIGGIFMTFDQCVANPDPMGTGSGSNLKFNNSKKRTKIHTEKNALKFFLVNITVGIIIFSILVKTFYYKAGSVNEKY